MDLDLMKFENFCKVDEKLGDIRKILLSTKKQSEIYQNMLVRSKDQYAVLEKRYSKIKQILRQFQDLELNLLHRENFYQKLLQEKDAEYNATINHLKDHIRMLEQVVQEAQGKTNFPLFLPYNSVNLTQLVPKVSPQFFPKLNSRIIRRIWSDTELSDDNKEDNIPIVEKKSPLKDELDVIFPQHKLLDNSVSKSRAELVYKGALAHRQLPSGKQHLLTNDILDCSLENSYKSNVLSDESSTTSANKTSNLYCQFTQHQLQYSGETSQYSVRCTQIQNVYQAQQQKSYNDCNLNDDSIERKSPFFEDKPHKISDNKGQVSECLENQLKEVSFYVVLIKIFNIR